MAAVPIHPGLFTLPGDPRGPAPYGFGIVDLPEGMRAVTRPAEASLERLRRDLPVRLEIAPLFTNDAGDAVLSFAYAPLEGGP